MPRLSVWMVRAALVHLVAGFALGALLLASRAMALAPGVTAHARPLHIELLLLGWLVNLGFGVGYWILPGRADGSGRDADLQVGAAFALLNGGVLLAGFGQALAAPGMVPLIGRVAEAAAAALFAAHAWRRVRPYGAARRPAT
jgi:hypothetical protein